MKKIFTLLFLTNIFFNSHLYSQRIVDTRNLGLDTTGKSDVSSTLNNIIDSLSSAGGGTILIPSGKFLLENAIILQSFIHLKGVSESETIFFRKKDSKNWTDPKIQALITTNPSVKNEEISVEKISINGNFEKGQLSAKGGICLRNCTKSNINDVTTENTWHGVAFYDSKEQNTENSIENVSVFRAQGFTSKDNAGRPRGILVIGSGILVKNSKSSQSGTGFYAEGENITLLKNYAEYWFEDNGYYLIVNNLKVIDCRALGGDSPNTGFGSGFAIAYKQGALIENCLAENCSNYGFRIHVPQSNTKLINNQAVGCGNGFGIETASHPYPEISENLLFQKNIARNSGLHGFLFRQMKNARVLNNSAINGNQRGVTLSTRGAIAIKEYVSDSRFRGNLCFDNQLKTTQIFGLYNYSVDLIKSEDKKAKNIKIKHQSKSGIDIIQ
ncbi:MULTISPECIES: right-handed parallel beta-helix repeat-containing protein [unclassified Algoriphagus]|jgi:hypothetical protein|uniref:right-handed parallel beta-helix repeat-containing protein n=1 Tax=unclassified Algoriphagus TaxID=2641541 RepID=UPI000C393E65|nr:MULTISPECIES: right-handed parallel beta-helix repeat-containing protein [unclassified Algoriphagus]MAL14064.1 hypothetical protein [Algoriphagus sp.]HAS58170.1 hypothetical protein [Algoriphagus sp.]